MIPFGHQRNSYLIRRALVVLALASSCCLSTFAGEWPRDRGPHADGISTEDVFLGAGPFQLSVGWKSPAGSGYSGIVVAGGQVVTMFSAGDSDVMAAFDPKSGAERWRFEIGSTYAGHDGSHDGPLATPVISGEQVFGLSATGRLFSLKLDSGELIWSVDLVADRKARSPFYGFSTSPLLQDGVLIVEMGGEENFVSGFDPASGELRWTQGADMVMHQSPIPLRFEGRGQVVVTGNTKLMGLDARSGEVLWEHAHGGSGPRGIWSMTPVSAGEGRLFLQYQDEASAMVELVRQDDVLMVNKLWESRSIKNTYNIPIYHDGHLYAFSTRILTCVNAATGEMVWRSREPGDGFMVLVDGHLVITTKSGSVHVAKATPEGYQEVAGLPVFDDVAWAEPAAADGSLYVRSLSEIARVDVGRGQTIRSHADVDKAPGSVLSEFLKRVATAGDKKQAVNEFLNAQKSFPIVEESGMVHFLYRGAGTDLAVAGDMIGARQERSMTRVEGTDLFHYSMQLEPDARVNYLFVRDYEGITDPRNPRKTSTDIVNFEMELVFDGEETEFSWLAMPGWKAPPFLEESDTSRRGRMVTHELESKLLEKTHSIHVYLPAGYDGGEDAYPVAYFHGGAAAEARGPFPQALDNLIGTSVASVIVVFIQEPPPPFGPPTSYVQMVLGEMIPFMDSTYRTIPSAEGRASLGNGSTGFPALVCALMQPGVIGKVATQGAWLFGSSLRPVMGMIKTPDEQPLDIYMDWGLYDVRSPQENFNVAIGNRNLAELFKDKGYAPKGGEAADGTGWSSWSNRTDALFQALFPAVE